MSGQIHRAARFPGCAQDRRPAITAAKARIAYVRRDQGSTFPCARRPWVPKEPTTRTRTVAATAVPSFRKTERMRIATPTTEASRSSLVVESR